MLDCAATAARTYVCMHYCNYYYYKCVNQICYTTLHGHDGIHNFLTVSLTYTTTQKMTQITAL